MTSTLLRPPTETARAETQTAHWLKAAPVMLHSVDEEGRFVAVSDYWLQRLGYTQTEIIGRYAIELLTPESQQRSQDVVFPALLKAGSVTDIPYQLIHKDGSVLDMLLSSVFCPDAFDGNRQTISVLTDVTALKRAEARLAKSEALYRALIEHQSELVSLATPDGKLLFVNNAYANHFALTPERMIGCDLFSFIPLAKRDEVIDIFRHVTSRKQPITSENQVVPPGCPARWFSWTNTPVMDPAGTLVAIHSVGRDIDQRVKAEDKLRQSEARYRLLADNLTDMVFELDLNLRQRYVSAASRDLLGILPDDLIGTSTLDRIHSEDQATILSAIERLRLGVSDRETVSSRMQHLDGRWIWVEGTLRFLKEAETNDIIGLSGALRDITERKEIELRLAEANAQLERLALLDGLTGLDNRRSLDARLAHETRRAIREQQPLSVLLIDVDWFKDFNDHYGHIEGDDCLRRVATVIAQSLRRPGDFIARFGGEEFVVLLPNTPASGSNEVASMIQSNLRNLALPHALSKFGRISLSIGLTTGNPEHVEAMQGERLLTEADVALYRAKRSGRNTVVAWSNIDAIE